jgi:hypothetical protein
MKYVCSRCKMIFYKKNDYERHLSRKIQCTQNNDKNLNNDLFCIFCDKKFNRKDKLQSHIKITHSITNDKVLDKLQNILITSSNNNKSNNNKSNNNSNNKSNNKSNNNSHNNNDNHGNIITNNITNNYIKIIPFGKDGTDCLSFPEKMKVFSSETSPLETIIDLVNLNPEKPENHNVGVPDLKSAYGIIYDGKKWNAEKVTEIVNSVLATKKKDLTKIGEEIKNYVKDEKKKEINDHLEDYNKMETNPSSRKLMGGYVKKQLYNKRQYSIDAKKQMESNELDKNLNEDEDDADNEFKDILREGLTMKEAIKHNTNKKIIQYVLDTYTKNNIINTEDHKYLIDKLNAINDSELLDILFSVVIDCIYLKEKPSDEKFNQKININDAINNYLNNH